MTYSGEKKKEKKKLIHLLADWLSVKLCNANRQRVSPPHMSLRARTIKRWFVAKCGAVSYAVFSDRTCSGRRTKIKPSQIAAAWNGCRFKVHLATSREEFPPAYFAVSTLVGLTRLRAASFEAELSFGVHTFA